MLTFTQEDAPEQRVIDAIKDGLIAYNVSHAGPDRHLPLWLVGRDEHSVVQAGLKGVSFWNWMFVEWLWVSDSHRKHGYGSLLLEKAETIARERGCTGVFLDTYSFQAPDFYQKHGYSIFGTLPDCPVKGRARHYLSKCLTP